MAREIRLRREPSREPLSVLVDDEDYELVAQFKWYATSKGKGKRWYAYRQITADGRRHIQYMHRLILNPPPALHVDHANGNTLDNRRSNIRLCTPSQNNSNRTLPVGVSGYRGVHPHSTRWFAQIEAGGVYIRTGLLGCPIVAARCYNALAREFHGEFARLNDIPDHPPGGHSHEG